MRARDARTGRVLASGACVGGLTSDVDRNSRSTLNATAQRSEGAARAQPRFHRTRLARLRLAVSREDVARTGRTACAPDLAQMIADLKPGFIRWPGGCFAEGITIESRPQWKRSIGRLEDRDRHLQPVGLLVDGRLRLPRVPAVQRGPRRRRAVRRQRRRLLLVAQRHVPAGRGAARTDPGRARRDRVRDRTGDARSGARCARRTGIPRRSR